MYIQNLKGKIAPDRISNCNGFNKKVEIKRYFESAYVGKIKFKMFSLQIVSIYYFNYLLVKKVFEVNLIKYPLFYFIGRNKKPS